MYPLIVLALQDLLNNLQNPVTKSEIEIAVNYILKDNTYTKVGKVKEILLYFLGKNKAYPTFFPKLAEIVKTLTGIDLEGEGVKSTKEKMINNLFTPTSTHYFKYPFVGISNIPSIDGKFALPDSLKPMFQSDCERTLINLLDEGIKSQSRNITSSQNLFDIFNIRLAQLGVDPQLTNILALFLSQTGCHVLNATYDATMEFLRKVIAEAFGVSHSDINISPTRYQNFVDGHLYPQTDDEPLRLDHSSRRLVQRVRTIDFSVVPNEGKLPASLSTYCLDLPLVTGYVIAGIAVDPLCPNAVKITSALQLFPWHHTLRTALSNKPNEGPSTSTVTLQFSPLDRWMPPIRGTLPDAVPPPPFHPYALQGSPRRQPRDGSPEKSVNTPSTADTPTSGMNGLNIKTGSSASPTADDPRRQVPPTPGTPSSTRSKRKQASPPLNSASKRLEREPETPVFPPAPPAGQTFNFYKQYRQPTDPRKLFGDDAHQDSPSALPPGSSYPVGGLPNFSVLLGVLMTEKTEQPTRPAGDRTDEEAAGPADAAEEAASPPVPVSP